MKKTYLCFFFSIAFSSAMAADEMPSDLLGKWVFNDESMCQDKNLCDCAKVGESGLIIGQKSIKFGIDESCEVKKISQKNGSYKISQRCTGTEGNRNITKSYFVKGKLLTTKEYDGEHNWEFKYKRCPD
jgi:hypothetical protein